MSFDGTPDYLAYDPGWDLGWNLRWQPLWDHDGTPDGTPNGEHWTPDEKPNKTSN